MKKTIFQFGLFTIVLLALVAGVFAQHTTDIVSVTTEINDDIWLTPGFNETTTFVFKNNGSSTDWINRIAIYIPTTAYPEYNTGTPVFGVTTVGWECSFGNSGLWTNGYWVACTANSSTILSPGSAGNVSFELVSPEPSSDTLYVFNITTRDNASTAFYNTTLYSLGIDVTPPKVTWNTPDNDNVSGLLMLNATVTDTASGVDTVYFNVTNASGSEVVILQAQISGTEYHNTSFDTATLPDGSYTARAFAKDNVLHMNDSESITFTVDNDKPTVTVLEPISDDNVSGTITIKVSAQDSGTGIESVTVKNVSGDIALSLVEGTQYDGNWSGTLDTRYWSDGQLMIFVNVTDFAGNLNSSESVTVDIDNNDPVIYLWNNPPDNTTVSGSITLNVTANDTQGTGIRTLSFTLDGLSFNATASDDYWTSQLDTTQVSDGTYNVTAVPLDFMGNDGIDHIVISELMFNGPGSDDNTEWFELYNPTDSAIDISGWSLDPKSGAIYDINSSPAAIIGPNSVMTFAENASWFYQEYGFMPDRADDTFGGSDLGNSNNYVELKDGSSTIIDALAWGTDGKYDWTTLFADEGYTLSRNPVTSDINSADDWESNTTRTPGRAHNTDYITMTVDNTGPQVTINLPVSGSNISGTKVINTTVTDVSGIQSVYFNVTNTSTYLYSSNNIGTLYVNDSFDTTQLPDGMYTLRVLATDSVGNTNNSETVLFVIDNNAPTILFNSPANNSNITGTVMLNVTVSDTESKVKYVRYYNGTSWISLSGSGNDLWTVPLDTTSFDDGAFNLTVNASDHTGNSVEKTITVSIDNTPPQVTLTAPATDEKITGTYLVTATSSSTDVKNIFFEYYNLSSWVTLCNDTDASDGYGCSWNTLASPTDAVDIFVRAKAYDHVGLSNDDTNTGIDVDNTAPQVTLSYPLDNMNLTGSVTVNATSTSTDIKNVTFAYYNGSEYIPVCSDTNAADGLRCTWNTAVVPGDYNMTTLQVRAFDYVSLSATDTNENITIDNTMPSVTLNAPLDSANISGMYTLQATTSTDVASVTFRYYDTTWHTIGTNASGSQSYTFEWNTTALNGANIIVNATATDHVGLSQSDANTLINIDNTVPQVPAIYAPASGENLSGTITFNASATDAESGIMTVYFNMTNASGVQGIVPAVQDNTFWYNNSFDSTTLGDGTYTVFVYAFDHTGKVNSSESTIFTIDNSAPQASFLTPLDNANVTGMITVQVSAQDSGTGITSVMLQNGTSGQWRSLTLSSGTKNSGTWTTSFNTASYTDGSLNLTVNATDYTGKSVSQMITINIDNSIPNILLTNPVNDETISGIYNVIATSSSTDLSHVLFEYDNGTAWNILCNDTNLGDGLGCSWDTTSIEEASLYDIRATATDMFGLSNDDTNTNINIDNKAPVVTLTAPADSATITSTNNITLSVTAADTFMLSNCTLYTNVSGAWQANTTQSVTGTSDTASWTLYELDGTYTWNVRCTDSEDNSALSSSNYTFTVNYVPADTAPPAVTLNHPVNNQNYTVTNNVTFNATVTDNIMLDNCTLFTDISGWKANATVSLSGTAGTALFTVYDLVNGTYVWNTQCFDNSSNSAWAGANFTFHVSYAPLLPDTTAPTVTLNNPADGYLFVSTNNITLNITASDDRGLDNCTIYTNTTGAWAPGTSAVLTGTLASTVFSYTDLANATFAWNALCFDNSSNSAWASANKTFSINYTGPVIDTNAPVVTLNAPVDMTNLTTTNNATFNVTATDDTALDNCTLYTDISGSFQPGTVVTYTGTSDTNTWTINNIMQGTYVWNTLCFDNSSNSAWASANNTLIISYSAPDSVPPVVTLNSPANMASYGTTNNVTFNVTATDNAGLLSCTLYTDVQGAWQPESTKTFTGTSDTDTFTVTGIPHGSYIWNALCLDNSSNSAWAVNRTFSINTTNSAPVITSYTPVLSNPKIAEDGSQLFTINKSDPDNNPLVTSWYIDNIRNTTATDSFTYAPNGFVGNKTIKAVVNDSSLTAVHSWTLTASNVPISTLYSGTINQVTPSTVNNATGITIIGTYGKIDFLNNVLNLSDLVDVDNVVNISRNYISVDSDSWNTLNTSAKITLTGLTYIATPAVYWKTGSTDSVCPANVCTNISYNMSSGTLEFYVSHFTAYYTQGVLNSPPVITSTPVTSATVNKLYTYNVDATDANGHNITYILLQSPPGMTINSATGLVSWTPTAAASYSVVVGARDLFETTNQSYTVTSVSSTKLAITDLDITVDGEKDKNVNNLDKIGEDAKPGVDISFDIEIENLYDEDTDMEIEDIEVQVTIEDIDDGDDLEEEADEFDLDAEENEKVSLDFSIPWEVDEDTYTVKILVSGEDENNTLHELEWELYLDVDKDRHSIKIRNARVSPSEVTCTRSANLYVNLINIGSDDEDEVALEVVNSQIGIRYDEFDIELEEGTSDNTYDASFTIDLSDAEPGTYPITVRSFYQTDRESDSTTVDVTVSECIQQTEVTEQVTEQQQVVVEKAGGIVTQVPLAGELTAAQPVTATRVSYTDNNVYIMLIAILFILLLGLVIFAIGVIMIQGKKRRRKKRFKKM